MNQSEIVLDGIVCTISDVTKIFFIAILTVPLGILDGFCRAIVWSLNIIRDGEGLG